MREPSLWSYYSRLNQCNDLTRHPNMRGLGAVGGTLAMLKR